jgi:hypothetical protein
MRTHRGFSTIGPSRSADRTAESILNLTIEPAAAGRTRAAGSLDLARASGRSSAIVSIVAKELGGWLTTFVSIFMMMSWIISMFRPLVEDSPNYAMLHLSIALHAFDGRPLPLPE